MLVEFTDRLLTIPWLHMTLVLSLGHYCNISTTFVINKKGDSESTSSKILSLDSLPSLATSLEPDALPRRLYDHAEGLQVSCLGMVSDRLS
jgi:hypothetical protein